MIRFRQLRDVQKIADDTELWREVYGYMAVCVAEFLETEDAADLEDQNFNFAVASLEDVKYLRSIGEPEETATIDIKSGFTTRRIHRFIYTTEVLFFDEQITQTSMEDRTQALRSLDSVKLPT